MSRPTDEQIVAYFDQCQALIRDHGWMVQGVFPTDDTAHDDLVYPFCYTIGLAERGQPELLMVGDLEVCHAVLNIVAERYAVPGAGRPVNGELLVSVGWKGKLRIRGPVDDVAAGTPVHMARNYLAWRGRQELADGLDVFQVEWPNPDGLFLDDEGAVDDGRVSPQLPMRGLVTP